MRTLRPLLAGTVAALMASTLPLGVAAQADSDEPTDVASGAPAEVALIKDLVYATITSPDGEVTERTLMLRHAAGSEDAPMVLDVGGTVNSRTLAKQGVSVFVMGSAPDLWPDVLLHADPMAVRAMAETVACAVRFARGSEYGSETASLVLTGFSADAGVASHVALAAEDFDRVWEGYYQFAGGPPTRYDCAARDGSTRVDGFVGIAGPYDAVVGYEGKYGREHWLEHEPDAWEMLYGTVGSHPELRVRLLHGTSDGVIPLENSAAFETVLAEAGYDVELVEFDGGHTTPGDLAVEAVMELLQ